MAKKNRKARIQTMIRRDRSARNDKYGIGGALKERHKPVPVTLAKLKFMEDEPKDSGST